MQLDVENKDSKWYDAIKLEMKSMLEYKVFENWDKVILDKHKKVMNPPKGYHKIKVHLVSAVKNAGRHKARFVAYGLLTPEPIPGLGIMQLGLELINLILLPTRSRFLLDMLWMSMKSFLMTCQNHLVRL